MQDAEEDARVAIADQGRRLGVGGRLRCDPRDGAGRRVALRPPARRLPPTRGCAAHRDAGNDARATGPTAEAGNAPGSRGGFLCVDRQITALMLFGRRL
jgi:hypothetical protein